MASAHEQFGIGARPFHDHFQFLADHSLQGFLKALRVAPWRAVFALFAWVASSYRIGRVYSAGRPARGEGEMLHYRAGNYVFTNSEFAESPLGLAGEAHDQAPCSDGNIGNLFASLR